MCTSGVVPNSARSHVATLSPSRMGVETPPFIKYAKNHTKHLNLRPSQQSQVQFPHNPSSF